ncbi:hypothetical protein ElyMa_001207300 [Elysia marginata]|uniref:Uncharacterized protein n=1 Tax=Elysia marginata TaxID=1093978 RepID=A0AAV4I623_9GAST|nr:hypothetical protein ElyMa_001207300 [Elysia marginata]
MRPASPTETCVLTVRALGPTGPLLLLIRSRSYESPRFQPHVGTDQVPLMRNILLLVQTGQAITPEQPPPVSCYISTTTTSTPSSPLSRFTDATTTNTPTLLQPPPPPFLLFALPFTDIM